MESGSALKEQPSQGPRSFVCNYVFYIWIEGKVDLVQERIGTVGHRTVKL